MHNPQREPEVDSFSIRQGAYLPHWRKSGVVYAITFRLADSLPQQAIMQYKTERAQLLRSIELHKTPPTREELIAMHRLFREKIDKLLDAGAGACWMSNPAIAELVAHALRHFDQQRYNLSAWCVMPNHVHVMFDVVGGFTVESILHSWKSFTATKANKYLCRKGDFWQTEYYNHIVRDDEDFANQINYVAKNPEAAGLENWPWVWVKPSIGFD